MARLIDADTLRSNIDCCGIETYNDKLTIVEQINEAPTVDAVPVVRCRDCKRCFKHTTKRNRQQMWICMRNEFDVCVRPDDFCSYGERNEGEQ